MGGFVRRNGLKLGMLLILKDFLLVAGFAGFGVVGMY
jgi:hypothetical protein